MVARQAHTVSVVWQRAARKTRTRARADLDHLHLRRSHPQQDLLQWHDPRQALLGGRAALPPKGHAFRTAIASVALGKGRAARIGPNREDLLLAENGARPGGIRVVRGAAAPAGAETAHGSHCNRQKHPTLVVLAERLRNIADPVLAAR